MTGSLQYPFGLLLSPNSIAIKDHLTGIHPNEMPVIVGSIAYFFARRKSGGLTLPIDKTTASNQKRQAN